MMQKKFFFRLPLQHNNPWGYNNYGVDLHYAAGTAIAAVVAIGQKPFAEVRVDERGVAWTDYYTLHPEGIP